MQFITGSHTEGYFDHVQSKMEGNILNENQADVFSQGFKDKFSRPTASKN